jgi:membrane protein implicated in regulation of membrane protease activity
MEWLFSLYIGTAVFGLGITIIDFVGMLDDNDGDGDEGAEDGLIGDGAEGDEVGSEMEAPDTGDFQGNEETDGDTESDSEGEDLEGDDSGSKVALQEKSGVSRLIKTLQFLRFLVYFSLGFGPIGFVGTLLNYSWLETLFVALGLGTVTSGLAFWIKGLLGKSTDSQISAEDMIMEQAVVTVSISPGQIGKVRLLVQGRYEERYAKLKGSSNKLITGTEVRVVDFDEEFLYVEKEY